MTEQGTPGVLDGVRVVELGMWLAGPVSGGVLADWGAEVVKIEPLTGDPMRRLYSTMSGSREDRCPPFDMFNRGKRSVALNVNHEGAAEVLDALLAGADVLLTNMRPSFLQRIGLGAQEVAQRFPRLVYASLSGFGPVGPDRNAPGFDVAAFTARTGISERMQPPDGAPASLPGGMGDVVTGTMLVTGICAALFARERTGRGQVVTTSLLRAGIFSIGMDVSARVGLGRVASVKTRETVSNPLMNCYPTADGSWFWLIGAESDKHWPRILAAAGARELADDERFATPRERRRNGPALVARLDEIFRTKSREQWAAVFAKHDVWWSPVNAVDDLAEDPQVLASGAIGPSTDGSGTQVIASPIDFGAAPIRLAARAPGIGADTVDVLRRAGLDDAAIARLAEEAVVGVATEEP